MKKIVFILAMLLFSFNSFASYDITSDKLIINKSNVELAINNDNLNAGPTRYTYRTSCGVVAVSYSYEPVSASQYDEWAAAMEEFYCEELE